MGTGCSSNRHKFTSANDDQKLLVNLINNSIKPLDDELTIIVSEILNKRGVEDKDKAIMLKEFCNGIHGVVRDLKSFQYKDIIELEILLEEYFLVYEERSLPKIIKKSDDIRKWLKNNITL